MALKDASREVRLQWFARAVIDASFEGLDIDADEIQRLAKSAGLVDEHTATEADIEARDNGEGLLAGMENAELMSAGDTWLTFSDDIKTGSVRWDEISETATD